MCWSQELLCYQFSVIHSNNQMMIDVDVLTHRFRPLFAQYCMIANILSGHNRDHRPESYDPKLFGSIISARFCSPVLQILPILTTKFITYQMYNQKEITLEVIQQNSQLGSYYLQRAPLLFYGHHQT